MIKSLKLVNFQSHTDSFLEFSEGVNVIVGSTDSGKSAIMRSIFWLNENRPLGIDSVKNWKSKEDVLVELVNEENTVIRTKGKTDAYQLSGIKDPFMAFGQSVPEEIKKALNLQNINYQKQIDAPFLFSNSPGYVAEHFNKMCNIHVTDKSIQYINGELNKLTSAIGKPALKNVKATGLFRDIEKWTAQLSEFDNLEHIEIEIEVLEQMTADSVVLKIRQEKLNKLIQSIEETEKALSDNQAFLNFSVDVDQLMGVIESRNDAEKEIDDLSYLITSIKKRKSSIDYYSQTLAFAGEVDSLIDLISKREQFEKDYDKLKTFLYNIKETKQNIRESKETLDELEKEFHENMPDTCPLCGRSG